MSDIRRVVDELDMMEEYMVRMGELCYKGDQEVYREHARIIADAREVIDQMRRDMDAVERVRDGRAIKIFHRGVVMINFNWWKHQLETEGKWRAWPDVEDIERAAAEEKDLTAAAATSPPEGETRGEAAGWISVEDRLPEPNNSVLLAVYDREHEFTYRIVAWLNTSGDWDSNDDEFNQGDDDVLYWMPLPEPPEG